MAPATRESSSVGVKDAVCTSATLSADPESSVMAQAAPTPWISAPKLVPRLASQMRGNTPCFSGSRIESPPGVSACVSVRVAKPPP